MGSPPWSICYIQHHVTRVCCLLKTSWETPYLSQEYFPLQSPWAWLAILGLFWPPLIFWPCSATRCWSAFNHARATKQQSSHTSADLGSLCKAVALGIFSHTEITSQPSFQGTISCQLQAGTVNWVGQHPNIIEGNVDRAYGITRTTNLTTCISKSSESSTLLVYQVSDTWYCKYNGGLAHMN